MKTIVFEEGGATGETGDAVIVCDSAGRPLPVDVDQQAQIAGRPNGIHGVFPVYGFDLIVTATWDSREEYPYSWMATQVGGGIVAIGYGRDVADAVADAVAFLRPAVQAALGKATCQDCTHLHYRLVGVPG